MEEKVKNKGKVITIIALIVLIVLLASLCVGYIKKATLKVENPIATLEVKDYGTIKIELYPDKAPDTVANFIALANNGFYDGIKFDEINKDAIIQIAAAKTDGQAVKMSDLYTNIDGAIDLDKYCEVTGSKKKECKEMIESKNKQGAGSKEETENEKNDVSENEKSEDEESSENEEKEKLKDEAYCIKGEFVANGFEQNDLNLEEGTIVMTHSDYSQYSQTLVNESYDSATSQFFIITSPDYTGLSGNYAGFGKVIEGMDIAKKIARTELKKAENAEENAEATVPVKDVVISSVRVDTKGINYGMPKIYEPFNLLSWYYSNYNT